MAWKWSLDLVKSNNRYIDIASINIKRDRLISVVVMNVNKTCVMQGTVWGEPELRMLRCKHGKT